MPHTRTVMAGLAVVLLLRAAPASATPLLPGDSGIVPTALGAVPSIPSSAFLFDSGRQTFTFGAPGQQVSVAFGETILRDPFTPLFSCGANCLDFVLQAQLVSGPAGATTLLTSESMNTFGTSSVDVGWFLDHTTYVAPSGADRGTLGDTVTFDFSPGIPIGSGFDTSQVLLIRTNLTSFSSQNFVGFTATEIFATGLTVQQSGLATVQTAVPEPSSILLVAGGALVVALRRLRSVARP